MPKPNCGACKNVSEICVFLGTVGVTQIFIKDYAKKANPLNCLLHKNIPFEWGPAQEQVMDELKRALLHSPALSSGILAVNTSKIAVGYQLCQQDSDNSR